MCSHARCLTWHLRRTVGVRLSGATPALWKMDIDSAFRRVPLKMEHCWASWVVFMCKGKAYASQHKACPFGASSSVHAWERVGALLTVVARRVLKLPIFRYVDDVFSADRHVAGRSVNCCACVGLALCDDRPESVEHALQCMVRLTRAVLGPDAVAEHKAEFGAKLTVLGVLMTPKDTGFECRMSTEKAQKCVDVMQLALHRGVLQCGCASKLAGRLSWGTQFLFKRLGRAMLRPIFRHAHRR